MVIFTWLVLALLAGYWARRKHLSFLKYFLLSAVLTPIVGLLAVAFAQSDRIKVAETMLATGELRKCDSCGNLVRWNVPKCDACGAHLKPLTPP